MATTEQPINQVQWVHRDTLQPNHYNPNAVAPPELNLLEQSILQDGWTQPIVVCNRVIVDGFHRWTVSGRVPVYRMTGGLVPVVELRDVGLSRRMASTVRHNRARGVHGVLRMADIVEAMFKAGMGSKQIQSLMGMEAEEVARLADRKGIPASKVITDRDWSQSWSPE